MLGNTAVAVHPDDNRCMHPGSCLAAMACCGYPISAAVRLLLFDVLQLD